MKWAAHRPSLVHRAGQPEWEAGLTARSPPRGTSRAASAGSGASACSCMRRRARNTRPARDRSQNTAGQNSRADSGSGGADFLISKFPRVRARVARAGCAHRGLGREEVLAREEVQAGQASRARRVVCGTPAGRQGRRRLRGGGCGLLRGRLGGERKLAPEA